MKLKELFRGRCFPTLNDLNLAMTQRIRELHSNGWRQKASQLLEMCHRSQWDYIERRNVKIDLNE